MPTFIARTFDYISQMLNFIGYISQRFKLFYVVLALTLTVLCLEYAATSLMIPMALNQSGNDSMVVIMWLSISEVVGLPTEFRTWLWFFLILMGIRLALGYLLTVLTTSLGKQVHKNLSGAVFGHILLTEPMGEVYTRSVGHYVTLAGDDTFKSGTIVASLLQTLVGLLTAIVGMVVLFQFSLLLFWSVVVFLVLSMVLMFALIRAVVKLNACASTLSREASTTFLEALNSLRSIRSLHGERFVMATYAEQIQKYIKTLIEVDAIKAGVKAFPAIVLLMLAAFGLRPGAQVTMTDAALFAGTVIIIRVFASLGQMVTAGSQLLIDIRAIKDIEALVELGQDGRHFLDVVANQPVRSLSLERVSFGYGDRGRVLDEVSFRFNVGLAYAIVGPSGAGKSSLADILLGLSVPDSGNVVVNEGKLPIEEARSSFMLVEQQPKIFSTTVRDNLLLGKKVSDDDLYVALGAVNLDALVRSLDQGLDTRLTYQGENFSGGQRQRLGIARALVRKPEVLILDEATSALDAGTRAEVVGKLRAWMREGIIIFITHDPEIAALADEVLSINGQHAESAEHEV